MTIQRRTLIHDYCGDIFESVVAWDDAFETPRPGVLVLPNIRGQKESDSIRAERLAALGYVGLAIDIYGQGKRVEPNAPVPGLYMDPLNADRALLRDRLHAALATLKDLPEVDPARTAAIGFCFGGKCALDLARTGADLLGVVSFHGVYDPTPFANVTPIAPKVLVCHGWDDPLCPPEATMGLATELTESGADWQIHAYGHTGHAFTDESVDLRPRPVFYQPDADRRSWQAMGHFLAEIFAG